MYDDNNGITDGGGGYLDVAAVGEIPDMSEDLYDDIPPEPEAVAEVGEPLEVEEPADVLYDEGTAGNQEYEDGDEEDDF